MKITAGTKKGKFLKSFLFGKIGITLDKVVVDLGKKESMDGLTYVALSRMKKLNDMVIESFPFERINKLSDGKRFK